MKRKIIACVVLAAITMTGCSTEADKVVHNIAVEADNFNVYRRVVIINTRTDKPEFEVVGKLSVTVSSDRLDVLVEEDGRYYKHIINLTDNNMFVIEDLGGADVSQFKYEVNYIPQSIVPYTVTKRK